MDELMMGCKQIKRQIDEADRPGLLSYEATRHIDSCADCQAFASERAGLRELLGSTTRVTAPSNFDAMLRARLAERAEQSRFAWLTPAVYMRFGAATAMLVAAIFVAQMDGSLFNSGENPSQAQAPLAAVAPSHGQSADQAKSRPVPVDSTLAATSRRPLRAQPLRAQQLTVSRIAISQPRAAAGRAASRSAEIAGADEDRAVVLVRGRNGERELSMPTVSVGAQPLMYVSAGRQVSGNIRASF
ncbi:MAG TPA: hypothetical protein VJQ56_00320 [Blastocatellia bacterium]|nr:hypothetical protein [Blastocatellia bacterium]